MENFNFILPQAQGGCFSRRVVEPPPEPPPQLNLGPPPPVHWEETDSDESSSTNFSQRLNDYVVNYENNLANPIHVDDIEDDSYDDEQFAEAQADFVEPDITRINMLFNESLKDINILSNGRFVIPQLGVNLPYAELGIISFKCFSDLVNAKCLYQFVIGILNFYKDLMGKTYLVVINEFGAFITKCLTTCFDFVTNHINILDMPQAQSENDSVFKDFIYKFREVLTHYDRMISSEFAKKTTMFLALITMSPICIANGITFESFGITELIQKTKENKISKMSNASFVYNVLDTSCYMAEKLQYIIMNGNLYSIYIDDIQVKSFEDEYTFLKYYEDKLNLLPNHEVTLDTYLKRVDALQGKLRDIKEFYSRDVAARYLLIDYKNGLARMKYAAMDKLKVSSERPLPIGLMLYGPPGIGKSVLTDQIMKICYDNAIYLGHFPQDHKYKKDYKYVLCPEDEFMSEFRINHEVIMMDDVDQFKDKINEAKEGGLISKAISFVNEIPYVTPQAHLEDKGKIPLMCEFVVGTTNSISAGINLVFKEQSGALRRFIFLDIEVKPEYRVPGTSRLGSFHDENELLLHDFHVRRYEPTGTKYNLVYLNPDTKLWCPDKPRAVNLNELAFLLRDCIQAPHYRQAGAAKDTINAFLNADLCEKCGITSLLCDCDVPLAQSSFVSRRSNYVTHNYALDSLFELFFIFWAGSLCILFSFISFIPRYLNNRGIIRFDGRWLYSLMNATMIRPFDTRGMFRSITERIEFGVHILYMYSCHSEKLFRATKDIQILTDILERHKNKILLVTGLGIVYISFKLLKYTYQSFAGAQSNFVKPKSDENQAKDNPWARSVVDLTVLPTNRSSTPKDVLMKIIDYNLCHIVVGGDFTGSTSGFGLYSNYMLLPKHFYDSAAPHFPLRVTCLRAPQGVKIGPNRDFYLDHTCLVSEDSVLDYVIISHGALGPFRDMRPFMIDEPLSGKLKAVGMFRNRDGNVVINNIDALTFHKSVKYRINGNNVNEAPCYIGVSEYEYKKGDCGSPILAEAKNGVVIASYHIAGMGFQCYSIPFYRRCLDIEHRNFMELNSFNGINLNETYVTSQSLVVSPMISPKCPSNWASGTGELFGSIKTHRRKMKSTVCNTLYCNDVLNRYGKLDCDYFSPKDVNSRYAIKLALESSMNQPVFIPGYIQAAELAIASMFVRNIDQRKLYVPDRPFDLDVGINGCDGVTYIDRLPVSTSGGFAHKGSKLRYLRRLESLPEHSVRYGFDDDLQLEYDKMLKHYQTSDEAYSIVWDFNLKDEPISAEKIRNNKCRVFNAGPFVFNVLVRQYFLWCVPIFSGKYRHEFGMAIGANVLSEDWTNIYDWVTRHGENNMIAGDYKSFDKNMPREIMMAAFQVLLDIMAVHGWSYEDRLIARRLASEIVSGLYNADGTLIRLSGNPSGNCLTTIINSIANIMYIMIACISIEAEMSMKGTLFERIDYNHFFDYVSIVTYGDDNIMSSKFRHINHTSISNALRSCGLEYTMADKESESKKFIHISECDFLKRSFKVDTNIIGVVSAPLAEKSIIKALTVCNKSDSINFEEQNALIIDSCCREFYQYGRARFEHERVFLDSLVRKYKLGPWLPRPSLPLYEELLEEQLSKQLDYSFKVRIGLVPPP